MITCLKHYGAVVTPYPLPMDDTVPVIVSEHDCPHCLAERKRKPKIQPVKLPFGCTVFYCPTLNALYIRFPFEELKESWLEGLPCPNREAIKDSIGEYAFICCDEHTPGDILGIEDLFLPAPGWKPKPRP